MYIYIYINYIYIYVIICCALLNIQRREDKIRYSLAPPRRRQSTRGPVCVPHGQRRRNGAAATGSVQLLAPQSVSRAGKSCKIR